MTYVTHLLREGEMIQPELTSMSTGIDTYANSLTLTSNIYISAYYVSSYDYILRQHYVKHLHQLAPGGLPEVRAELQFVGPSLAGTVMAPWQFMH